MNDYNSKLYADILRWRVRFYWISLIFMFVYTFICLKLGLGDSRKMTNLSDAVSDIILFGGPIYLLTRIYHYKKMLKNEKKMLLQYQAETDEKSQYLYDKSGGITIRILILVLLFMTCTFALYNITAFYVSFMTLLITISITFLSYKIYNYKAQKP